MMKSRMVALASAVARVTGAPYVEGESRDHTWSEYPYKRNARSTGAQRHSSVAIQSRTDCERLTPATKCEGEKPAACIARCDSSAPETLSRSDMDTSIVESAPSLACDGAINRDGTFPYLAFKSRHSWSSRPAYVEMSAFCSAAVNEGQYKCKYALSMLRSVWRGMEDGRRFAAVAVAVEAAAAVVAAAASSAPSPPASASSPDKDASPTGSRRNATSLSRSVGCCCCGCCCLAWVVRALANGGGGGGSCGGGGAAVTTGAVCEADDGDVREALEARGGLGAAAGDAAAPLLGVGFFALVAEMGAAVAVAVAVAAAKVDAVVAAAVVDGAIVKVEAAASAT